LIRIKTSTGSWLIVDHCKESRVNKTNQTYQQFTKKKNETKENLRRSLPNYGWIPNPEACM
jgi:hypothetical protein